MSERNRTARMTAMVTLIIFVSKALGFIRESIIAAYFGTGAEADAYTAAYSTYYIPVLLFTSCISSTLLPKYMAIYGHGNLRSANRLASNSVNLFASFALIVAVVMYLAANPLMAILYNGFGAEKHALTVSLIRLMVPGLVFAVIALSFITILNARERFCAAQLIGFPLSFCVIIASIFFSERYGVRSLAFGVLFTGISQVLILLPSIAKVLRYRWVFNVADPAFRSMLRLAGPAILSMSATEINNIVDKSMASGLATGSLSSMNYAFRLVTFVNGVLVVPLVTILFSRMSARAAEKDRKGVVQLFREGAESLSAIVLPVTIVAAVLARPVIRCAFMRGAFDENSLVITSGVFAMYILGELFFGVRDLLNRAFHAVQDTKTPMLVSLGMIIVNIIFNTILIKPFGINGLALSTSLSGILCVALLLCILRYRTGKIGLRSSAAEFARIAAASAAAGATALLLRSVLPEPSGFIRLLLYLAITGGSSMLVYLGAAWVFGSRNIRNLRKILARKGGAK